MARVVDKLTARGIETEKKRGYHGDGNGLYLLVGPTGAKSWVFRYRADGRLREMGLGPVAIIGLAQAREKATESRRMRYEGRDPIEIRRTARMAARLDAARAMTFSGCAEAYIKAHKAGWKNDKHAAQWPSTLNTYVYPVFGAMPVQTIDTDLVMKVLEPIWTTKPETASRIRGRIESILDWATTRSYRQGENPARWRGHLENLLPARGKVRKVNHHSALPYADLPAFMAELRAQDGVAARALEFAILTAARTGEVLGARWSEIDAEARLWIVPAERMKAGKEHRVPLTEPAVTALKARQTIRQGELREGDLRHGDFIFPGNRTGRPLSNMAFLMLLRRMGRADLTAHGFRSTFSDWAAEQTDTPSEVREMALAHAVSDKVEAAYRRGDLFEKRRQLASAWAAYCTPVIEL